MGGKHRKWEHRCYFRVESEMRDDSMVRLCACAAQKPVDSFFSDFFIILINRTDSGSTVSIYRLTTPTQRCATAALSDYELARLEKPVDFHI